MNRPNPALGPPQGYHHPAPPPNKKHTVRNVFLGIILAFVVLIGGCTAITGSAVEDTTGGDTRTAADREAEGETDTSTKPKKDPTKPEGPVLTAEQEQAVGSAEEYLDDAPLSKVALIRQLSTPDGFSKQDATVAVNSLRVDYKAQAAKSAKNHLNYSSFTRQTLIQKLTSTDDYTQQQAEYGVTKAGLK